MKRLTADMLVLPLLLVAPCASAQEANAAKVSAAVDQRFAALPEALADLPRVDGGYDRPMAAYKGPGSLDPIVAVVVTDVAKPTRWLGVAELGRSSARRAGLVETLFEGRFGLPQHPAALIYFGDYLTQQGIQQSWIAEYDGIRITVSATIYRVEDRAKVFDAIRQELFGGATLAKVSTAEAN